jgi:hypothetical protein
MKLNKEELLVGFVYGSCSWPVLGWLAVIPGLVCSPLWAIGGSGPKMVRRIGVPVVVGISLAFISIWLAFVILPLWGIVSIGYGIPDSSDKGSALGRFYTKLFPKAKKAANWATRLTVFLGFNIVIIAALAIVRR